MSTPRVLFRAKPVFARGTALAAGTAIVSMFAAVLSQLDAWPWRMAAFAAAAALALLARRHKFVTELAVDGEDLLVRTLFQSGRAQPLRIPVAETSGWREYVETSGRGATRSSNRIVSFRHRGIRYGMAVDHAVR
jgi:hypothetical protein